MKKMYGIATAMTTPFLLDGHVDVDGVRAQTEMLVEKGVHCLYPCGTTGEMLRIPVEERKKVAEAVIAGAKGKAGVFIHCGAACEEDVIELSRHAEEKGADGIGVVTPQFFRMSARELEEFYVRIASAVSPDFPIYMYNIPQKAANDITVPIAAAIRARAGNIVGLKYSAADVNRTIDYTLIDNGNFSVMHGADRAFLAFLAIGCDGTISGSSGVFPEPFVAGYKAFVEGRMDEALMWQRKVARICDILTRTCSTASYKAALAIRGVGGGYMKKPQLDLAAEDRAVLEKAIYGYCEENGFSVKV